MSGVNAIAGIIIIVIRYGFFLSSSQIETLVIYLDIVFLCFILIYAIRLTYSYKYSSFIRRSIPEFLIIVLGSIHGLINYLSNNKLLLTVIQAFYSDNSESIYINSISIILLYLVLITIIRLISKISNLSINPPITFILSFVLLISFGAIILMLPTMTTDF